MVSRPSSSSDRYASRTDTRLVRYRSAMSRSAGSFSPGRSAPSEICCVIREAIASDTRPDRRVRAIRILDRMLPYGLRPSCGGAASTIDDIGFVRRVLEDENSNE
jgi:hypothetical protein